MHGYGCLRLCLCLASASERIPLVFPLAGFPLSSLVPVRSVRPVRPVRPVRGPVTSRDQGVNVLSP